MKICNICNKIFKGNGIKYCSNPCAYKAIGIKAKKRKKLLNIAKRISLTITKDSVDIRHLEKTELKNIFDSNDLHLKLDMHISLKDIDDVTDMVNSVIKIGERL